MAEPREPLGSPHTLQHVWTSWQFDHNDIELSGEEHGMLPTVTETMKDTYDRLLGKVIVHGNGPTTPQRAEIKRQKRALRDLEIKKEKEVKFLAEVDPSPMHFWHELDEKQRKMFGPLAPRTPAQLPHLPDISAYADRDVTERPCPKAHEQLTPNDQEWWRPYRPPVLRWCFPLWTLWMCVMVMDGGRFLRTYRYVRMMDDLKTRLTAEAFVERSSPLDDWLVSTLHDRFKVLRNDHAQMPIPKLKVSWEHIPVLLLALVFVSSYVTNNIRLWAKCCLCVSLFTFFKGLATFGAMAPDSAGWEGCKANIGQHGLDYYRSPFAFDFNLGPKKCVKEFVRLEHYNFVNITGWNHTMQPVWFCADNMLSYRSFTSTILALGFYDHVRYVTAGLCYQCRLPVRMFTGLAMFALVSWEALLLLGSRTHYTWDVVSSVALAFLMFSNAAVVLASDWYGRRGCAERPLWRTVLTWEGKELREDQNDKGSVLVPPCCVPFCYFQGRWHMQQRPNLARTYVDELLDLEKAWMDDMEALQNQLSRSETARRRLEREKDPL